MPSKYGHHLDRNSALFEDLILRRLSPISLNVINKGLMAIIPICFMVDPDHREFRHRVFSLEYVNNVLHMEFMSIYC